MSSCAAIRRFCVGASVCGAFALSGSAHGFALQTADGGDDVRWRVAQVAVVVDPSMNAIAPDALELVERSFAAWQSAPSTGAPLVVASAGVADDIGFVPGAANLNTVRYAPAGCDIAGVALATTVVTYDATGAIVDADVIVNGGIGRVFAELPAEGERAVFGVSPPYDIQNSLTHEAGHFYGLAHQNELSGATMFPTSDRGETSKRDLSDDDQAGLRALYPVGSLDDAPAAGCSIGGVGGGAAAPAGLAITLLVAGVALARRLVSGGRSRKLAAGATTLAMALGVAPSLSAPTHAAEAAIVVDAVARHEGGVIVTTLDIALPSGGRRHLDVYGGSHAGYTQVIGDRAAPAKHARLRVDAATGEVAEAELPARRR